MFATSGHITPAVNKFSGTTQPKCIFCSKKSLFHLQTFFLAYTGESIRRLLSTGGVHFPLKNKSGVAHLRFVLPFSSGSLAMRQGEHIAGEPGRAALPAVQRGEVEAVLVALTDRSPHDAYGWPSPVEEVQTGREIPDVSMAKTEQRAHEQESTTHC